MAIFEVEPIYGVRVGSGSEKTHRKDSVEVVVYTRIICAVSCVFEWSYGMRGGIHARSTVPDFHFVWRPVGSRDGGQRSAW